MNYGFIFQRADKQKLQTHLHVANFSQAAYDMIKTALKEGKVSSSSFNPLRRLNETERLKCLEEFVNSGYKISVLKKTSQKINVKMNSKKVRLNK